MKKPTAFTLIELLVTFGITALLMLAVSSLLLTFLATAYKSRISQSLRESGDNAMKQIVEMIRSASDITSACVKDAPLNSLTLVGRDGLTTVIKEEDDRIASVSASKKTYLTESSANSNYVSNLVFKCYPTSENKKYIEINFTLHTGDNTANSSARSTTLDFGSGIVTRN